MDRAAAAPAALLSLRPAALIAAGGGADVSHSSSFICTSFLFCTDKLHFGWDSFRRCSGADGRCSIGVREEEKDGRGDFRFHPPNCNAGYAAAAVRVCPFPSFFGARGLN